MQTKVILKSIAPVGSPVRPDAGATEAQPKYHAFAAVFVGGDFPADGVVPPDYAHLTTIVPFTLVVNPDTAKTLRLGGEYVMTLNPA